MSKKYYRLLTEALRRLIQIFFGNVIFDFPLFLGIRRFGYKLIASSIGKRCLFGRGIQFYVPHGFPISNVVVGDRVEIGPNVRIDCSSNITIEGEAWISENVHIFTHVHEIHDKRLKKKQDIKATDGIVIGYDSWISANAIILPEVRRIGKGAIIGAGSVVTKDIEDYAIAVGNPARIIGYRK